MKKKKELPFEMFIYFFFFFFFTPKYNFSLSTINKMQRTKTSEASRLLLLDLNSVSFGSINFNGTRQH